MAQYEGYTDLELWALFVKGDKVVLEALYNRHYDSLLNYGLKCSFDKSIVQDCIQDVFVKLYVGKRIKNTPYVKAYLLRSLKNALIDKINESKNIKLADDVDFEIEIEDSVLNQYFSQSDEQLHLSKKLLKAFSKLSVGQKQVVYFRFVKGLSHKEISVILDVNEQSAMNTLSRALSKLRKLITFFF